LVVKKILNLQQFDFLHSITVHIANLKRTGRRWNKIWRRRREEEDGNFDFLIASRVQ